MNFLSLPLFFQTLLLIILLFLLLLNLLDLILGIKRKIRIPFILLNGLTLAISFFVLLFLKVSLRCQIDNIPVSLFVEFLAICPLWILLLLLFLLLFASLSGFLFLRVYTKSKLTPNSFKESFDSLDSLICFCQDNGLPCLVNKKMNDFHIEVFQSRLLNGNDLWENLAKGKINGEVISLNQGYNPIIKLKTGEIYSFKRFLYKKEEKTIFEIIGNDVTSYYSLLEEIKEKNDSLRRLNKRLFEYGEKINQLIIEKEILEAKRKVHDDLGKLLLVTKKELEKQNFDKQKLLVTWNNYLNNFLLMKDNNSNDPYSELFKVGKQIGVDIDYSGIYVYSKEIRNIIVLSITETMMNVISHAKGSKLFVKVKKRMMKFQLILKMMESRLKKKL